MSLNFFDILFPLGTRILIALHIIPSPSFFLPRRHLKCTCFTFILQFFRHLQYYTANDSRSLPLPMSSFSMTASLQYHWYTQVSTYSPYRILHITFWALGRLTLGRWSIHSHLHGPHSATLPQPTISFKYSCLHRSSYKTTSRTSCYSYFPPSSNFYTTRPFTIPDSFLRSTSSYQS